MNWEQEAKLACEMKRLEVKGFEGSFVFVKDVGGHVFPVLDEIVNEWIQEYHEFLEKLAALEHDQWAHWTAYMLNNLTDENINRWKRQIKTPYKELSEDEKEKDRVWARKVLGIMFEEREILE